MREIIFDTETTGLSARDGDRVIEIGAVELVDQVMTGRTFHVYINPQGRSVHPDALNIHGISDEFLKDKPKFNEIVEEFISFTKDAKLVAHNAKFDMGFINNELNLLNRKAIPDALVIDTLQIAREKFPSGPNSLDALCKRYRIDNSHRTKHGALLDSELLAEVYIELMGGKQRTLELDAIQISETQNSQSQQSNLPDQNSFTAQKRAKPLPARLSSDDMEKHAEFVKTLGSEAIWNKFS